ncbi:MAG: carbohydrate binding family 9 domain-containing protein [Bacteroidales bacterium]|nr:carbohydrate binding family 9 domain-containing protein [Bacteroidales bacterium]
MKRKLLILFFALLISITGFAKRTEKKIEKRIYNAVKLTGKPPAIDGKLDDPAWLAGEWDDAFIQLQPYQGRKPSQKTNFKILYDNNNIYIAIKAFDSAPDSIEKRLTPKDDMDMAGDMVGVMFDSYFDHRTAFVFMVSAGGVKTDYVMSDDGQNEDATWDPIWYVKTHNVTDGWNAEIRIPLSQLRFSKSDKQVWGLEAIRYIYRKQELSLWQLIPNDAPGVVHLFGEMHGIEGIKPKKQLELAPYGVASYEHYEPETGNPFRTGKGHNLNAGLDGKVGLTNNITMDFTVNPDFGQVEADPSQLNLSAYETFYEEKRPFFVEGKNIFNYQLMMGDGDLASENLFYSRRIGRRPQGYPDMGSGDYARIPDATTILGAAKISGKTKNGLSIGILESVTAAEKAEIDHEGSRSYETIEPLTNYTVTRLQKDYGQGKTSIGGIFTSVNRKLDGTSLNYLRKSAYTGGLDFSHSWKNRKYNVSGKVIFSSVFGDTTAMIQTQRSSTHYFQRPDTKHLRLDSSRTSLTGSAGTIQIGKVGGGHWQYIGFLTWKSPGLELNDIGYVQNTDQLLAILWVGYRIWEPFSIFNKINVNYNQWSGWDFDGIHLENGWNVNTFAQFKNYWSFSTSINISGKQVSNSLLRGGPSFVTPGNTGAFLRLGTDNRKKLNFSVNTYQKWGFDQSSRTSHYTLGIHYRPISTFQISLEPKYTNGTDELQYVDHQFFNGEDRYLFAHIHQQVLEMSIRLNLSILPNLNIQFWGQPFIAAGKYTDFKRITSSHADIFTDRFHAFTDNEISYDDENQVYLIDENHDSNTDYYIFNPDFNYKSFKSNLVLHWEFVPGSNLYLVWSQNKNKYDMTGDLHMGNNLKDLLGAYPYNIFLIKFSYRFML